MTRSPEFAPEASVFQLHWPAASSVPARYVLPVAVFRSLGLSSEQRSPPAAVDAGLDGIGAPVATAGALAGAAVLVIGLVVARGGLVGVAAPPHAARTIEIAARPAHLKARTGAPPLFVPNRRAEERSKGACLRAVTLAAPIPRLRPVRPVQTPRTVWRPLARRTAAAARRAGMADATGRRRTRGQERHVPLREVELVQEFDAQAGVDERGHDLTERVVPAVLDEALRRRASVGI